MDTFEMLKRLLSQNEFELLLPDQTGAKEKNTDKTDIRLVYQMNDTIESFLVFKEARMTGTYKEDYEGAIEASFYRDGDDYALVVRQEEEDCVVTILFKTLELETNLYNYGDIAHFWRKGYENLRQLEFRIAVLWDKYEYLGEAVCNEETGSSGGFSTVELYLLSGGFKAVHCAARQSMDTVGWCIFLDERDGRAGG